MFEDIKNNIDFSIRNWTKFSRKNFIEKKTDAILRNEKENLYTYDVLRKYFKKNKYETLKILDIGCKNWFYAKGEYRFFSEFCTNFVMHGVELDAYRLYSNFYSRYEVAKFYTKGLNNTFYFAKNLLDLSETYDYIIWFLPFVCLEPLLHWGLPKKYYCPDELTLHAFSLLNKNGQMLIINQGEYEAQQQKKIFEKLSIPHKELGKIESIFFEYKNERFGWLIEKNEM